MSRIFYGWFKIACKNRDKIIVMDAESGEECNSENTFESYVLCNLSAVRLADLNRICFRCGSSPANNQLWFRRDQWLCRVVDQVRNPIFHLLIQYFVHSIKQHSGLVAFGCVGGQLFIIDVSRLPDFLA